MNELLTKLSSYNLFNYLFPGILFAVLVNATTKYQLVQKDIVTGVFVYYFIGLVISRFGSLVLGPLLKLISFVKFADYGSFVAASRKDPQIEVLSEANNTYRTLSALFVLLLAVNVYARIEGRFCFLGEWKAIAAIMLFLITFLFAYRKQTSFIVKRIKANE